MRPNTNTIKVELLTRISREDAVGADTPVEVVTQPVPPAPSVGNTPARAVSSRGPMPAAARSSDPETWTFINTLPGVVIGDFVIVDTKFGFSLGRVAEVDKGVDLQPGDTVRYQYVVCKLNFDAYKTLLEENGTIEAIYRDSYQDHIRNSFRETMLASLPSGARDKIQALLK